MTERVDLDRLADFVGGALDGTPDAAAVRTLIDTDPGWAAAHADLVAATAAVSADLRTVGSRPAAVPEDVGARLDAFLRQLGSEPARDDADEPGAAASRSDNAHGGPGAQRPDGAGPRGATASGPRGATGATGATGAASGPRGTGPRGTGPGRRAASRRARWAAALSAAAAVIAVGVGLIALVPGTRSADDSAATAPNADAGAAAAPEAAGPPPVVSGRDYQPGSFAGLGAGERADLQQPRQGVASSARPGQVAGGEPFSAENDATSTIPPELLRLAEPAARQACLDAIQQLHGGVPSVVEFARFSGRPALIVRLEGSRTGNGKPFVVAAGPDCGRNAGDVDEYYSHELT